MKRFATILLLLSLSILAAPVSRAQEEQQTRPRRAEQTTRVQPASSPSSANEPEEVDEGDVVRVNTTLVTVPVNVTDRNGRFVQNLRQQEFRIYEDGVEQQISYFASVDQPFTVALLMDTSLSVRFSLEEIQDAAIAFLDQLRPNDQVMIVAFSGRFEVLAEPTRDRALLRDVIRSLHSSRGTRLYKTIDFVVNQRLNLIPGRKAIVLFTDGVEGGAINRRGYEQSIRAAEASGVLVYPVQYETSMPTRNIKQAEMKQVADDYLREIAEKTGARLFHADTPQNLARAFALVAEELRHQYSLGYYPKRAASTGQRRQIKVRVNRPDLVVQARDSYISNNP